MPGKIVNLKVPFFSQRDNANNPGGSCNVTSCAMVAHYFGIRGNGNGQLEDQMYKWMIDNGLSRHSPHDLKLLLESYKLKDDLSFTGTLKDIYASLDKGRPVIVHTYATGFGHIFVINGYNDKGFTVLDPYGEWSINGYINKSGANLLYSTSLIACLGSANSHAEALERYARRDTSSSGIWMHSVYK
jgi:uncharacterized protein YvpB